MQDEAGRQRLPALVAAGDIKEDRLLLPVDDIRQRAERLVAMPKDRHLEIAAVEAVHQHFACGDDQPLGPLRAFAGTPLDPPEIEEDVQVPIDGLGGCHRDPVNIVSFDLAQEPPELLARLAAHPLFEIVVEACRQRDDGADRIVDILAVFGRAVAKHHLRPLQRLDHLLAPAGWATEIFELQVGPVLMLEKRSKAGNGVMLVIRPDDEAGVIGRKIPGHDDLVVEEPGLLV
jgi:hypothetical protein